MTELRFTVLGPPRTKGRPRFVNGRAITPPETRKYERLIGFCAQSALLASSLDWSHKGLYALTMTVHHVDRRVCDLDNFVKIVGDGLNRVLWDDDSQVREIHAYFGQPDKHRPRVEVTVSVLT